MSCMLRISGEMLDIDSLLLQQNLLVCKSWRKGEPRILKDKYCLDSGANFVVSDADFDNFERKLSEATEYLELHSSMIAKIASFPGVQYAVLDFAVALNEGYVSQHSYLPAKFIRAAATAGVSVEISHYACSKDDV